MPSKSQCQKQPAMTIKLVGDECVNKVTLITLCDGDGDGDGDGGGDGGRECNLRVQSRECRECENPKSRVQRLLVQRVFVQCESTVARVQSREYRECEGTDLRGGKAVYDASTV
jgi:hypothetical protein